MILLLAALAFSLNKAHSLLRYKVTSSDAIASYFQLGDGEVDVLFVGSSHMYRSVSPMEIWERSGITSHVLGSPSQSMAGSYYLIEEAIRTKHPKVIILELYAAKYDTSYKDLQSVRVSSGDIPWGKTRLKMVGILYGKYFRA